MLQIDSKPGIGYFVGSRKFEYSTAGYQAAILFRNQTDTIKYFYKSKVVDRWYHCQDEKDCLDWASRGFQVKKVINNG